MDFSREIEGVFDRLSGRQLSDFYTQKIDGFLVEIFNSIESKNPLALIATGGYGRAELAPCSDIDIMFFAKDKADSKKVETVLYRLWDTGLAIGHSFRTPEDCIAEAKKDIRTHTSLLESRLVAGDKGLYSCFQEKVYAELAYRKQKNFITAKLREMEKRHSDYGDSIYLLEPNVKEGRGGLRDIHTALWLSKVSLKFNSIDDLLTIVSENDFKRLVKAYDFLLKVRFCLHLLSRRRNDVLSFDIHDRVAQRLGFYNSKKFLGAERFMRFFYLKASVASAVTALISGICSKRWLTESQKTWGVTKKASGNFYIAKDFIIPAEKNSFINEPLNVIEAFYVFSKTGKDFSHNLKEDIRHSLLLINKRVRNSKKAALFFIGILRGKRIYETLSRMHDTGVLGRFIPEFGALRALVVYEPYHRYTVDEHTLLALKYLENLSATKYKNLEYLSEIMRGIKDKETLFMSLLFHDIGKAAGKHHGEEGYKRLKNIVERFNLDIEKRQRIEFLVKNHTLMSTIALKRESEDTEVIAQFAEAVRDEEGLGALYLITYADMCAVNPNFWTEWKAWLLKDLYEKTLNYLRGVRKDKNVYIENILSSYTGKDAEGLAVFLGEMPDRYLVSTPAEKIYSDCLIYSDVRMKNFAVSINDKPDRTTEITVGAWDSPGLFSKIVGFLSSKWLNILSARLYTGKKGLVIDKIQVSNWNVLWWDGMEDSVKNGLKAVVLENSAISFTPSKKEAAGRFEAFIELDNETSEDSTIVEFFSQDRQGLLYEVSTLFYEHGLNIISAKINTESDIAQDIFYLKHGKGKADGPKTLELLESLWKILRN